MFFSFGPSFFSMLQTSIHYGFRKAFPFPLGVSTSDIFIVVLMMTIVSPEDMQSVMHNMWVVSVAGIVIVCWGIYTFSRKRHNPQEEGNVIRVRRPEDPKSISMFVKGFLLNFFNPLIWIYWISVVSIVCGLFVDNKMDMIMIFSGMLGGCLCLDLLKCAGASLLQRKLTPRLINGVNKVTGLLLICFAVYLVTSTYYFKLHPEKETKSSEIRFVQDALNKTQSDSAKTINF